MTYYNITIPQLPEQFVQYCDNSNYMLSGKKKRIITHILILTCDTDIDTIARNIRLDGIKVSTSSIYLVLQWLTANGFVTKTTNGYSQVFYRPNRQIMN